MKAKRSLGQHFLVSSKVVEGILTACRAWVRDAGGVLEIGPGRGALTEGLAALGLPLFLVEKDDAFAPALSTRFPEATVLHREAQDLDLTTLAADHGISRWLVVGNLPYNVGTDIARRVLGTPSCCAAAVFMLQREVVAKLAATAGEEGYGSLAVWTQSSWAVENLFDVPPGAFSPPPKVTSAVVRLVPKSSPFVDEKELDPYHRFLAGAFGRPRRTLAGTLDGAGLLSKEQVQAALAEAGLPADARPGAVPPALHARLFRDSRQV